MANQTTISQALRRIKKLKGQLGEHRSHATAGVTHLATSEPAYSFGAANELAKATALELVTLQTAVAVANATNEIEFDSKKVTLAWAVRSLRELAAEIAWVKALPVKAQASVVEMESEYTKDGLASVPKTYTCKLPAAKRDALVVELQDRFDRLNDVVETANHRVTLP